MKQKIVIRLLSMNCEKCRCKAMKIAVCVPGVESAALTGPEKNQVEVVGDGIDSVVLTRRLRKNVAHAELVSVGEVKKEVAPPNKDDGGATRQAPVAVAVGQPFYGVPRYCTCCEEREPITCTIL